MSATCTVNEDLFEVLAFDNNANKYVKKHIPKDTILTWNGDVVMNKILGEEYLCEGTISGKKYSKIRINTDNNVTMSTTGGKRRNRTNRNRRARKNRRSTQRR